MAAAAGNTWSENSKRADAAISEVRRVYAAGMKDVTGVWQSDVQKQAQVNMQKLGPVVDKWAGERRTWAELGGRAIGSTWSKYAWATWLDEGKEHASAVKTHTSASYDAGFFTGIVAPAVAASAKETQQLAAAVGGELKKWGPWVLGAVALVAIAVIATNARSVVATAAKAVS